MIDYIGDLSRKDAELLKYLAEQSDHVLEFGSGASTQIFAAYAGLHVDSVDTEQFWIAKTRRNVERIEAEVPVAFHLYTEFEPTGPYDLCFIDGRWELRQAFAFKAWPALEIGGLMCFHDTRRLKDVKNVCAIIERYSTEIDSVELNQDGSNITVILKRSPLSLEDYNAIEGRTRAQLGLE